MNWVQHQGKVSSPNTNTITSVIVSSIRNKYKRQSTHTQQHQLSTVREHRVCCANNVRTSNMDSVRACFSPSFRQICMYEYECRCFSIGIFVLYILFFRFLSFSHPYPWCVAGHHLQSWSSSVAYGALLQIVC